MTSIEISDDLRQLIRRQYQALLHEQQLMLSLLQCAAKAEGIDTQLNEIFYDPKTQSIGYEPVQATQKEASRSEEND